MRVAFQMDPLSSLNPERDTTLLLITEALQRSFQVFYYEPKDMSLKDGHLKAKAFELKKDEKRSLGLSDTLITELFLNDMDVIWIRQDPPFNMAYITSTYLLDHATHPIVLNATKGLRECPEKLAATHFHPWMPNTLITYDVVEAQKFLKDHGPVIIKPLYEFGGRFILKAETPQDIEAIFMSEQKRTPGLHLMVQTFLPAVVKGDKRIFMLDGQVIGCFTKRPTTHGYLSNLGQGGQAECDVITDQEQALCQALSPFLQEKGLFFVGLDVIDSKLTEINVTSPTGIPTLNRLYGRKVEQELWDAAINLAKKRKGLTE